MKRLSSLSFLALFAATTALAEGFRPSDRLRIVIPSDPQISPDAKAVALVVSRASTKDNRWEPELVLVDVARGAQRPLAFDRRGVVGEHGTDDRQGAR